MELIEKIESLGLDDNQKKIATEKFLATFGLKSEESQTEKQDFLKEKGVEITKAHEISVLANSINELRSKFYSLEEVHHEDIYRQDPRMLNRNVIDLNRLFKYYDQNNIPYRNENGEYILDMFTNDAWKRLSSIEDAKDDIKKEEDLVTLEPVVDEVPSFDMNNVSVPKIPEENQADVVSFSDFVDKSVEEPLWTQPSEVLDLDKEIDSIKTPETYSMYDVPSNEKTMEEDFQALNGNIEDFKKDVAEKLDGVSFDDNLGNIDFNMVNFNDINPEIYNTESYSIGGRAA